MLTLVSSYPQLKLILLVWADILYYNWQAFGLGLFFDCNGWSNRNNMFSWKNLHLRSFSGIYSVERNPLSALTSSAKEIELKFQALPKKKNALLQTHFVLVW